MFIKFSVIILLAMFLATISGVAEENLRFTKKIEKKQNNFLRYLSDSRIGKNQTNTIKKYYSKTTVTISFYCGCEQCCSKLNGLTYSETTPIALQTAAGMERQIGKKFVFTDLPADKKFLAIQNKMLKTYYIDDLCGVRDRLDIYVGPGCPENHNYCYTLGTFKATVLIK